MTLQEAKNQIAKQYGYTSWENLRFSFSMTYGQWETFSDRAAELYAQQFKPERIDPAKDAGTGQQPTGDFISHTKPAERESGFYWVKYDGEWEVAQYYAGSKNWYVAGAEPPLKTEDFDQIDERPLKRSMV